MDDYSLSSAAPKGIKVEEIPNGTLLSYRWFSSKYVFMGIFSLLWDGFLFFFYRRMVEAESPWLGYLIPSVHVIVGIGLTYAAIAGLLNTTFVLVGQGLLTIRHAPIPWRGNRIVSALELRQLYVEEKVQQTKNGTSITYRLLALTSGGGKIRLISNIESKTAAKFIEREIERRFGLRNEPVAGQVM